MPYAMHHYRRFGTATRSFALLSDDVGTDSAVVFVHGFTGTASGTWAGFAELIDVIDPGGWWSTRDVFFYGYESIRLHIGVGANHFSKFLRTIFPRPPAELFETITSGFDLPTIIPPRTLALRNGPKYQSLVLVGHSEGALLLRKAVNDAVKLREINPDVTKLAPWQAGLIDAQLRLFAPAVMGESISGIKALLVKIVRPFAPVSPAYSELQPNSPVLRTIQNVTEQNWHDYRYRALRAAVCWGEKEDVVQVCEYKHDYPVHYEPWRNHTSICKPSESFHVPLEFVSGSHAVFSPR